MENKKKADILPGEILKFRKIEKAFIERCRQFGYQEIKTSSIEPLYIFTATNALSPDVLKRVYSFLDWGGWSGERVVLRPDLTISAVRYYLDYLQEQPHVKLCYIENYFLLDDTGREVSERWQFGVENIGDASPSSDAEAIFIALDTLKSVGFEKTYLHLSYPSVVIECINHTFSQAKEQQEAFKLIKDRKFEGIKSVNKAWIICLSFFILRGTTFLILIIYGVIFINPRRYVRFLIDSRTFAYSWML
jgi:histidyl-tRNA synthetase